LKGGRVIIQQTFYNLKKEKRERILEAVKREYIENEIFNVNVLSICKHADIPNSVFYRYFDNLNDSLTAVFENMEKKKIVRFREILLDNELEFISQSIRILEEMLDDEETYLFISTLKRNHIDGLPIFIRNIGEDIANDEQTILKDALVTVITNYTEDYYMGRKTKHTCLNNYRVLVKVMKRGNRRIKSF